jgi:hypothetical protein
MNTVSSTSKNNDGNTTTISTFNSNTTSLHSSNNINSTGTASTTAASTLVTNPPRVRRGLRLTKKQNLFEQPTIEFSMVMIIINICIYGLYTSFQANNNDGIKMIIYIVIINIVTAHTMRLRFYRYQVLTQKVEQLETIINNTSNNNTNSDSTTGIISSSSSSKYIVSDVNNNNNNNLGNDVHDSGYCTDSNNVNVSDNNNSNNNDHQAEGMNGMPIAGMTTS